MLKLPVKEATRHHCVPGDGVSIRHFVEKAPRLSQATMRREATDQGIPRINIRTENATEDAVSVLEATAAGVGSQQMVLQEGGGREAGRDNARMNPPGLGDRADLPAGSQCVAELLGEIHVRSERRAHGAASPSSMVAEETAGEASH